MSLALLPVASVAFAPEGAVGDPKRLRRKARISYITVRRRVDLAIWSGRHLGLSYSGRWGNKMGGYPEDVISCLTPRLRVSFARQARGGSSSGRRSAPSSSQLACPTPSASLSPTLPRSIEESHTAMTVTEKIKEAVGLSAHDAPATRSQSATLPLPIGRPIPTNPRH